MQALLRTPRAPLTFTAMAVVGLCLFVFAIAVLMQPASSVVGQARTAELVCLQIAFVPENAVAVLANFTAEERGAIADLLVPGDIGLAWGMGLTLAGLTALLAMRLPGRWFTLGALIIWVPFVAATFDTIEDIFLRAIVVQLTDNLDAGLSPVLPFLAGIAASLKYLALIVVTPAYGFAGIVKGIGHDRSASAWVVYVLLALALASVVPTSWRNILACF